MTAPRKRLKEIDEHMPLDVVASISLLTDIHKNGVRHSDADMLRFAGYLILSLAEKADQIPARSPSTQKPRKRVAGHGDLLDHLH